MWNIALVRASLALCLVAAASTVCGAQSAAPAAIAIKIYDTSGEAERVRASAIEAAASIVGDAGIRASWFDCTGDAERGHCTPVRGARTLVVRIVSSLAPGGVPSHASIRTRTAPDTSGPIIGFAVVHPSSGAGTLATVLMDRVQSVASRTAVSPAVLAGRAIAHEVGHLLLGRNAHSCSGLMREAWTDEELARDRQADWQFSSRDRGLLQANAAELERRAGRAAHGGEDR